MVKPLLLNQKLLTQKVNKIMKIKDLKPEDIKVGLRIKSLVRELFGTVVKVDHDDDDYAWIQWDNETVPTVGFWGNDCECEVVDLVDDLYKES